MEFDELARILNNACRVKDRTKMRNIILFGIRYAGDLESLEKSDKNRLVRCAELRPSDSSSEESFIPELDRGIQLSKCVKLNDKGKHILEAAARRDDAR